MTTIVWKLTTKIKSYSETADDKLTRLVMIENNFVTHNLGDMRTYMIEIIDL